MAWFELLREIEPFDELPFDQSLVEALEAAAGEQPLGVLRFFTPTFRSYASDELKAAARRAFQLFRLPAAPARSIAIIAKQKFSSR